MMAERALAKKGLKLVYKSFKAELDNTIMFLTSSFICSPGLQEKRKKCFSWKHGLYFPLIMTIQG